MEDKRLVVIGSNPSGLCMCGCGRKTKIVTKSDRRHGHVMGQPFRFIHGHSRPADQDRHQRDSAISRASIVKGRLHRRLLSMHTTEHAPASAHWIAANSQITGYPSIIGGGREGLPTIRAESGDPLCLHSQRGSAGRTRPFQSPPSAHRTD